jgi:SAM-dependent methyltransferase
VTHAGNTVRLVQRLGKIPVAVARRSDLGEMANDHQVEYLKSEEREGRVTAVWEVDRLADAVRDHVRHGLGGPKLALPPPADGAQVANLLDELWERLERNPFRRHPMQRYAYAWEELAGIEGPHLDVGCGSGDFLATLVATTPRSCRGVDPHPDYVHEGQRRHPALTVEHAAVGRPLPYPDATFTSVSLLDVLEHCPDEDEVLREVRRVLRPDGVLVLTVPARHVFSWLDPDNVKFRFPRLHAAVYSRRFGADVYRARFVDEANGLFGDMSIGKGEHTNYRPDVLLDRLAANGFATVRRDGANLFWRWFHGPSLLAGRRVRALLERAIWLDARVFSSANLFLTARRLP